jgi:tetratricopeptide (TPR) repeat protein
MKSQVISQSQRRHLQQMYERAVMAMKGEAQNHQLAHQLLSECVVQDPATPIYINALLDNLKQLPARSTWTFLSTLRNWKFFLATKHPPSPSVIGLGLRALYRNPGDLRILCQLATTCLTADLWAAAECYLRQALTIQPGHQQAIQLIAESLLQQACFEESLYYWEQLSREHTAKSPVRDVIGCLQDNLPTRPANPTGISQRPEENRFPDIEQDPTVPASYMKAARKLCEQYRWDEAIQLLERGLTATGANPDLLDLLETVRLDSYRHRIQIARQLHQIHPPLLGSETLGDLQSELARTELQVNERRARRYPTDYHCQLQLAICLRQTANYRMALKQLEGIPKNNSLAPEVTLETGKCQQHLRQFTEAAATYQHLIDNLEKQSEPCIYEQALYHGGILAAAMGLPGQAQQWLSRLLDRSPDYQDARDRLDKMVSMSDNRRDNFPPAASPGSDS